MATTSSPTPHWVVTRLGLTCRTRRDGQRQPYFLPKAELDLSVPMHVAAKPWVDIEEFLAAYRAALARHRRPYSPEQVDVACAEALALAARRREEAGA